MKYGFVTTNLLDLWAEPRYNSERASQLLFGEVVRIRKENSGYYRVEQVDGYSGWLDKRFIAQTDHSGYERVCGAANSIIRVKEAAVTTGAGKGAIPPHYLYYGTILVTKKASENHIKVIAPRGRELFIKSSSVRPIIGENRERPNGSMLIAEAKRFLGVPYLWGGVSPAGFDCSGLVRAICAQFGFYLPRDTKDQISVGTLVDRSEVRTGDLLFFKRHVGFAIGRDRIIHSSMSGGGVRINSLAPGMADYRADLDRDFNQARRIL